MIKTFRTFEAAPPLDPAQSLLIYDRRLEKISPKFKSWTKHFPHRYGVVSGERLKSLRKFPRHFERLALECVDISPRELTIVAVGGGTVGDFAGFFASVFKRGVGLIHVPSTWLAALDSSHGGKTALNNEKIKNQLGTFYPAQATWLVRELLDCQSEDRIQDAMGELAKIAVLDGGAWTRRLETSHLGGAELLWSFLKPAIRAKMKVVEKDPVERTGYRQILNWGHTVGHVLEAIEGWTHGFSVAQGLFFSVEFALRRGDLKAHDARRILRFMTERLGIARAIPRAVSRAEFARLLRADKKRVSANAVSYLVPRRWGRIDRVILTEDEIVTEARRQGWVR